MLGRLILILWGRNVNAKNFSETPATAAALLSAMANPKRLQILSVLIDREMPVGALAARVGLSQSALSQHLSKLRAQNLVETRREAQTIYYSTHSEPVLKLLNTLDEIYDDEMPEQKRAAS